MNIAVDYYDPHLGAGIETLIKSNTRVIFLESPGSFTFEIQDIPAITKVARDRGVTTILDNTWSTPLFFKSFSHGVDVSVHAATKYLSGHSDVVMGAIICAEHAWSPVRRTHRHLGQCVGPDDTYVTLRSIRNLSTRLNAHHKQGLALAEWLNGREEVVEVLHPGSSGNGIFSALQVYSASCCTQSPVRPSSIWLTAWNFSVSVRVGAVLKV